jgi:protein arginine N-methyltransferase 1
MSRVVDEHREFLTDAVRLSAFHRAVAETVQPGHVVLDLGCGTGILGLLACRAGAKRVYAIDEGGMIELARALCRANGFHDRVTFIKGLSTRVTLPEPVDVVLADQIGHFGFEAGLNEYFNDAKRRFLKPGGATIPSRVDLHVAPVEQRTLRRHIEFWKTEPAGFDMRPARAIAVHTGYPIRLHRSQILGRPVSAFSLDPTQDGSMPVTFAADLTASRVGTLHGIGGWFSARLSPHVAMTNSPLAKHRISRRNVVFPIDRPVRLGRGDRIAVKMHILPAETMVTWTVTVWKKGARRRPAVCAARFTHSTLNGMLIAREDLRRTRPDGIPILSPWGLARRTVLELCDGKRPLNDIEQTVFDRHRDLFRSHAEAATFTAEVVTRYAL